MACFLCRKNPTAATCWSPVGPVIHCYAWLKTLVRWETVMSLTCKAESIWKSHIVVIRTIMPEWQSHRTAKQSQKWQSTEIRVTGLAMGWRKVGRNHHMSSCSLAVRYGCLAAQCICTWLTWKAELSQASDGHALAGWVQDRVEENGNSNNIMRAPAS